jgi:hypothetical protein
LLTINPVPEDGQDGSDYHNTMTGAKFIAWMRNRLLPTFAELYPGKKMQLVLDNASYHCGDLSNLTLESTVLDL